MTTPGFGVTRFGSPQNLLRPPRKGSLCYCLDQSCPRNTLYPVERLAQGSWFLQTKFYSSFSVRGLKPILSGYSFSSGYGPSSLSCPPTVTTGWFLRFRDVFSTRGTTSRHYLRQSLVHIAWRTLVVLYWFPLSTSSSFWTPKTRHLGLILLILRIRPPYNTLNVLTFIILYKVNHLKRVLLKFIIVSDLLSDTTPKSKSSSCWTVVVTLFLIKQRRTPLYLRQR